MAIIADLEDKDKEKDNNQLNASAPISVGAPGQPSIASTNASPKGTSSGRFTNIQNFIRANQGNQLGSNIAGRIGGLSNQVQQNTNKEREAFQQQTAQAFQPFQGGKEFTQQAISDPTKVASDESGLKRFQTITQGQYSGPQQLQNINQLQAQAQNVQNLAGLTTNEGGRQSLLRNFFSNPSYTQGQRSLDNLLLQTDPRQLRQLSASRSGSTLANRNLQNAQQQAFAEAQGKAQEAKLLGQEATQGLVTETGTRQKELAQRLADVTQQENQRKADFAKIQNELANNEISEEDAIKLGLIQPNETDLNKFSVGTYGANLADSLNTNIYGGPLTEASVASQEQASRLNALSKLAGKDSLFNQSDVGKYQESTQTFDPTKMARDIARQKDQAAALRQQEASYNPFFQAQQTFNPLNQALLQGDLVNQGSGQEQYKAYTDALNKLREYGFTGSTTGELGALGEQIANKRDELARQAAALEGKRLKIIPRK